MDQPIYNVTSWPNAVACFLIFLNCCLGIYFNTIIIHSFITGKHHKTSFNLICVFRAFNNIFMLSMMLFIYIPATILGYSLYPKEVESVIITFGLNLMVFNEFQGIYLAVNRFIAIYFPIRYNMIFGIKLTFFLHILYYLDRIRNVTFESIERHDISNYLLFSTKHLAYGGLMVAPDGMFLISIGLVLLPLFINIFTFIKFYFLKKASHQSSENLKRAQANMKQFFQTVLQDSLFSISVTSNLKLNVLFDHRFWTFISQTFVWQSTIVLDGFIMIIFNDRLSLLKKSKFSRADTKHVEISVARIVSNPPHVEG